MLKSVTKLALVATLVSFGTAQAAVQKTDIENCIDVIMKTPSPAMLNLLTGYALGIYSGTGRMIGNMPEAAEGVCRATKKLNPEEFHKQFDKKQV